MLHELKVALVYAYPGKYIRGIGVEVQSALLQILRCGQRGLILFTPPRSAISFMQLHRQISASVRHEIHHASRQGTLRTIRT